MAQQAHDLVEQGRFVEAAEFRSSVLIATNHPPVGPPRNMGSFSKGMIPQNIPEKFEGLGIIGQFACRSIGFFLGGLL